MGTAVDGSSDIECSPTIVGDLTIYLGILTRPWKYACSRTRRNLIHRDRLNWEEWNVIRFPKLGVTSLMLIHEALE